MNILFFLHKFPVYGGVERMTINLVSALNQKGYNIYIISQKGEAEELLSDLSPDIKLLFSQIKHLSQHTTSTISYK